MATVALCGDDTININNHVFNDLADTDAVMLTYPNDKASIKTGKNGNALYALNETGRQCEVVMRIVRASTDDKFMQNLLANQDNNFAGFPLMTGEFVKKVGNGAGAIAGDTYIMSGGIFSKAVEAKMNVEGDTEQAVSIYRLKFSNAPRVIT